MDTPRTPLTVTIPLAHGKEAIVDLEDADLVAKHWYVSHYSYPMRREKGVDIKLHRLILTRKLGRPIKDGLFCDHINGNPLVNTRANLRETTMRQNRRNSKANTNSFSKYKGVKWGKELKLWRATLSFEGVKNHLGYFTTEKDASFAYDVAALRLQGEYARLNNPKEEVLRWKEPDIRLRTRMPIGRLGVKRKGKRWQTRIWTGTKRLTLGTFDTIESATKAYDRKAIELRGKKAITNFPLSDYKDEFPDTLKD